MQRILIVYAFVLVGGALVGLGCSRATEESATETLESARTTVDYAGSDLRDHANAAGARAEVAADELDDGLGDTADDVERGIDEVGADLANATAEGAARVEREARETEREARDRAAE
jgi:gas vesicle protein